MKPTRAEQRLQNVLERVAAAQNSGLHGPDTALENFRDFLVAEAFEVAQNHRAAKDVGTRCKAPRTALELPWLLAGQTA